MASHIGIGTARVSVSVPRGAQLGSLWPSGAQRSREDDHHEHRDGNVVPLFGKCLRRRMQEEESGAGGPKRTATHWMEEVTRINEEVTHLALLMLAHRL